MGYSPPDTLLRDISELRKYYFNYIRRYVPPKLKELLENKSIILNCASGWKPEHESIKLVYNEVLSSVESIQHNGESINKKDAARFQFYLVAALVFAYKMIEKDYKEPLNKKNIGRYVPKKFRKPFNYSVSLVTTPKNCNLYKAIQDVLKISDEKKLDALTVVECCMYFYECIKEKKELIGKGKPYESANILAYEIDKIIEKQMPLSNKVEEQVFAITFLESMAEEIIKNDKHIAEMINKLAKGLQKNTSGFKPFTIKRVKDTIFELFKENSDKQRLNQMTETEFFKKLIENNDGQLDAEKLKKKLVIIKDVFNKYALFGASYLVLKNIKTSDNLNSAIKTTLKLKEGDLEDITIKKGLNILSDWVWKWVDTNSLINYQFWTSKGEFDQEFLNILKEKNGYKVSNTMAY